MNKRLFHKHIKFSYPSTIVLAIREAVVFLERGFDSSFSICLTFLCSAVRLWLPGELMLSWSYSCSTKHY